MLQTKVILYILYMSILIQKNGRIKDMVKIWDTSGENNARIAYSCLFKIKKAGSEGGGYFIGE